MGWGKPGVSNGEELVGNGDEKHLWRKNFVRRILRNHRWLWDHRQNNSYEASQFQHFRSRERLSTASKCSSHCAWDHWALEVYLVQTETCQKSKIHIRFQRSKVEKKNIKYLNNFYIVYLLKWNYLEYTELNRNIFFNGFPLVHFTF